MDLSDRVRERMKALGFTQEGLANRAGVSQALIYKILSRKSKGTTKLVELADSLECTIEWLATGNDSLANEVRESQEDYANPSKKYIKDLKKKLKALPAEEQKSIAMEIMDNLIGSNEGDIKS